MKERDEFDMSLSSAELRKIRKPLIERKRRERINESLESLKALLLQAYNRHDPQYTKMEKADILEMAVEHLQYHRARQSSRQPSPYDLAQKYTAGFRECVAEVARCMGSFPEVSSEVKHRLMRHLTTYSDTMTACNGLLATQGIANQNQGYAVPPTNQRQDYNANIANQSQFSPPIQNATKHVVLVPKPIKLEPAPYNVNALKRTPYVGPLNATCHLGDLKSIETTRIRSDHVESPEEGATTSAQSSAEAEQHRTVFSRIAEPPESSAVSRRLEFDESRTEAEESEAHGDKADSVGDRPGEDSGDRDNNYNNNNNIDVNNVQRNDFEDISDDEDDMWRPW